MYQEQKQVIQLVKKKGIDFLITVSLALLIEEICLRHLPKESVTKWALFCLKHDT